MKKKMKKLFIEWLERRKSTSVLFGSSTASKVIAGTTEGPSGSPSNVLSENQSRVQAAVTNKAKIEEMRTKYGCKPPPECISLYAVYPPEETIRPLYGDPIPPPEDVHPLYGDPCPKPEPDPDPTPDPVKYGPGPEPDPDDPVIVKYGPGPEPDPDDPINVKYGPGPEPDPDDPINVKYGPGPEPDPDPDPEDPIKPNPKPRPGRIIVKYGIFCPTDDMPSNENERKVPISIANIISRIQGYSRIKEIVQKPKVSFKRPEISIKRPEIKIGRPKVEISRPEVNIALPSLKSRLRNLGATLRGTIQITSTQTPDSSESTQDANQGRGEQVNLSSIRRFIHERMVNLRDRLLGNEEEGTG